MLVITAHPDDESFSVGGTIAKYHEKGWDIHLIVATNGEKRASGVLRQEETKKAADVLGICSVRFLGLPDGRLKELSPGTLEDPLYEAMYALLPDVVITYGPTGITNHPDHIKVCYATTYAFQKYTTYLCDLQKPEILEKGRGKLWKQAEYQRTFGETQTSSKEPKLYYISLPQSSVNFLLKEKQIPEESHGKPWKGTPDKDITTIISITETKLKKGKALLCHETQMEDVDKFISFAKRPEVEQECFVLRMQGVYEVFMGKTDRFADTL